MNISCSLCNRKAAVTALVLAMPATAWAQTSNEDILKELETLRSQVSALSSEVQQAAEWKNPNTLVHMAGYADVGYSKSDAVGDNGSFNVGTFSPIFHFQYRDLVMLESELELEVGDDGETEVTLEYLTIDWFINDNMALVAGQFLSPIGQFRQNLHPSWINKLPSAAPGFGHDGAAPVSDLGVQLRGGLHLGGIKANYAVYMGNGPELKAEIEPDVADSTVIDEIELDGVEAEAFGADRDGEKVFGGRLGILPMPGLEIGVSMLTGQATMTSFEAGLFTGVEPALDAELARDYDVTGFDVAFQAKGLDARYEYVKSEVAESASSLAAEAAQWETWYAQFAYKLLPGKYEVVARYTDFDSPHASADLQQTALGLNYLFTSNFIGKIALESNNNPNTGRTADDRWLLQLAYGF